MNIANLDKLIKYIREKKVPGICNAAYALAPTEVGHWLGKKCASCDRVATWLGFDPTLGIFFLFAFDKEDKLHVDQEMTVPRSIKMLERIRDGGEIYFD